MHVVLVGADSEENLGVGMIAASLQGAGHEVDVVPLGERGTAAAIAAQVLSLAPDTVGLAVQFQHRTREFLEVATALRRGGFRGHITAGGQHATLAWDALLAAPSVIDSIVLHEGEATVVALTAALEGATELASVPGLALPDDTGPFRTPGRALAPELDALPPPHRYRAHDRQLGMPFIPVSGSRGCWGSCAFCAITAYYRGAHEHGGGKRLRLRSVKSLADEMAALHHAAAQGSSLFCFHDDTFLLPRPADSVARLIELREALKARGVTRYGLLGKCRPETVDPALARALRALGVVRLFVGIENASQAGQDHLHRGTRTEQLEGALTSLHAAGILATYNLLLFEPDTRLADVRENASFLRRHPQAAGNFCRAEPFHGTRLHRELARRGTLLGDHRGWDYRIDDERVELLFRLTLAAFRDRNYAPQGIGNRHVGLANAAQLVRCFHDLARPEVARAVAQADTLSARIATDTADLLDHAIDVVEGLSLSDAVAAERAAVALAHRVAAQDRRWHGELDAAMAALVAVADLGAASPGRQRGPTRRRHAVARAAMAGTLLASAAACGGTVTTQKGPPDEGTGAGGTGGLATGGVTGDGGSPPVIGGAPSTGGVTSDGGFPPVIGGTGGFVGDGGSPPVLGGTGGVGGMQTGGTSDGGFPPVIGGTGGFVGDGGSPPVLGGTAGVGATQQGGASDGGFPPVIGGDGGFVGNAGSPPVLGGAAGNSAGVGPVSGAAGQGGLAGRAAPTPRHNGAEPVDHWQDVSPAHLTRSPELPLHAPPELALEARREGDAIRVVVRDAPPDLELTCAGPGHHEVAAGELLWTPTSPNDRLTLVGRRPGGVASTTLAARSVEGA